MTASRHLRRPPFTEAQRQDIQAKRAKGVTWLTLSQEYGLTAETMKYRIEKAGNVRSAG